MHDNIFSILYADDDMEDLDIFKEGLAEVLPQHFLHYVAYGDRVVPAVKEHFPNIIFLDFNLPGCSGLDCLKMLKADPEFQHIPVIMYSTSSSLSTLRECHTSGAARFLIKPVTYTGIFKGIRLIFQLYSEGKLIPAGFEEFSIDTFRIR